MKYLKLFFIIWVVLGTVSDEARAAVATREYCIRVIDFCCGKSDDDLTVTMNDYCEAGEKWSDAGITLNGSSEDCKNLCKQTATLYGPGNIFCDRVMSGGDMDADVITEINRLIGEYSGDFCPSTTTSEGEQVPECGANAYQCQSSCCCNPHYNYNGEDNDIGANNDCTPNEYEFQISDVPTGCKERNNVSFWYKHGPENNTGDGDSCCLKSQKGGVCINTELSVIDLIGLNNLDWRYEVSSGNSVMMEIGGNPYTISTSINPPNISGVQITGVLSSSSITESNVIEPVPVYLEERGSMFNGKEYNLHYYSKVEDGTEFSTERCIFGRPCKLRNSESGVELEQTQVLAGWVVQYYDGSGVHEEQYLPWGYDIQEFECSLDGGTFDLYVYPEITECQAGYYCPPSKPWPAIKCSAGTYCPKGSKSETDCPKGFYCPDEEMGEPRACPKGYYCPNTRMEKGTPCPGGTTSEGGVDGIPGIGDSTPGAAARTDCYIITGADNNATIFEDGNGIPFQLPDFGATRIYVK